ncbi:MAG: hypothetical protein J07AB43_00150 [Candidatus Nanosalina sp. J07AB43]|nr:MAG: hypothetical protein J07AB43_00150 [Candidatus Nanosalina sp. J07AB43]
MPISDTPPEWTTVTVQTPANEHYHRTEYEVWGQQEMDQPIPEITGRIMIESGIHDPYEIEEITIIACHSGQGVATLAYSEWDDAVNCRYNEETNKLMTYHMDDMKRVVYDESIFKARDVPTWFKIGGQWDHLW